MKIEGESWEKWLYPRLRRPLAYSIRRILPRNLLVECAAVWLRYIRSVYSTPYFRSVETAASLVLSDSGLEEFLPNHLRYVIDFYLEMVALMELSRTQIKERLSGIHLDVDALLTAIERGRGALVPTIQTSVPLRMIFAGFPERTRYNLLLHKQHPGILDILTKSDPTWAFLFLETSPARRIMDAFRHGQVVVCNIDHVYPNTEVSLSPVLGHPAIVPSGIFRIAQRFDVPVVPLSVTEDDSGVKVVATEVYNWDEDEAFPISNMLTRVQPVLDSAVVRTAAKWMGWGNLNYRWTVWKSYVHAI